MSRHLMHKLTRCMIFLHENSLNVNRTLVVSGGCASSKVLISDITKLCHLRSYSLHVPPPSLCIDNAVMIGYTAQERLNHGFEPIHCKNFDSILVDGFAKIGHDVTTKIRISKHITSNYNRLTRPEFSTANEINDLNTDQFVTNDFGCLL